MIFIFIYFSCILDGIIAIDKPYGMVTTDSDGKSDVILTNYLPALSQWLRVDKLYTVHRLDRDTTGTRINISWADKLIYYYIYLIQVCCFWLRIKKLPTN